MISTHFHDLEYRFFSSGPRPKLMGRVLSAVSRSRRVKPAKWTLTRTFAVTICCVLCNWLGFSRPAAADVLDIGSDGTVTVYSRPGVYDADAFRPFKLAVSRPRDTLVSPDGKISSLLASAAQNYALDPKLLKAVAWTESRYRAGAISPKGAVGVMQLMDGTARDLGVNRYDVSQNIQGGAAYLKAMLNRYGEPSLAVAAYNAGPGAVDRYRGVPPFLETKSYVQAVLGKLAEPIQVVPPSVIVIDR